MEHIIEEPHAAPAPRRAWHALRGDAALIALLPTRAERMQAFVRLVWAHMQSTGISWVGFYEVQHSAPEYERLTLAAREPGPACSPIGLHGACGQCLLAGAPLVIRDIRELGSSYIACDPRDLSELVLPCRTPEGGAWGVFDLDSHEIGSFCNDDAVEVGYLLGLAGLALLGCFGKHARETGERNWQ